MTKSTNRWIKNLLFSPPWNDYAGFLSRHIKGAKTLLDVGCGSSSPVFFRDIVDHSLGIDVHEPSIVESKMRGFHSEYQCLDITTLTMPDKSFDIVIALDLIEHVDKEQSVRLLDKMERIARVKVIVFTPNGFVDTSEKEVLSRYENNPWRIHRCGWTANELRRKGYHCVGINGLKFFRHRDAQIRLKPEKLFRMMSIQSQIISLWFPSLAFQLLAVKEIPAWPTK